MFNRLMITDFIYIILIKFVQIYNQVDSKKWCLNKQKMIQFFFVWNHKNIKTYTKWLQNMDYFLIFIILKFMLCKNVSIS